MQFHVLGPFRAIIDGEETDLGPPQQKAVLATLILHANQVVPMDQIVEAVWAESPPRTAEHIVHTYVSALRKVLDGEDVIVTAPSGYRLPAAPDDIDAIRFEQLLDQARLLMPAQPGEAAVLLEQALGLWRGPAFADFLYAGFADAEGRRLEELRLVALEEQSEAALALGQHGDLVAGLESLVGEHPFRERMWAQLMLALYRCGRQADALRAFQRLRTNLGRELGIEPSPDVSRLEERILLQDPELAPISRERAAGNLPVLVSSFVGREADLVRLADLIPGQRLVTLTGPAGVGKTRLAIEAGYRLRERFPAGVWFVQLADSFDFEQVVHSTTTALEMREEPRRPLVDQLSEYIADLPMLLVLDNCEQVIESVAALASSVLRASGSLHILATSRETLRAQGEISFRVAPLGFPDPAERFELDRLRSHPAVDLFCQRAEASDPGFELDEGRARAVVRLCAELDGLPLALELAAARTGTLTVGDIVDRIGDRFSILTRGERTTMPHHQTLEAAIAWSYELLDPHERLLFERLGVLAGFSLEGAEQVCHGEELEGAAIADTLARLVDKSLVAVEDTGTGDRRYRLLETIRSFALAKLKESGQWDTLHRRHAEYFLRLADAFTEAAEPEPPTE